MSGAVTRQGPRRLVRGEKIEVRASPIHGYGVFARTRIARGEIIQESPCLPLEDEYVDMDGVLGGYVYEWPLGGDGVAVVFGMGSVFNHGARPNVGWSTMVEERFVRFVATRDIEQDEELLIDYGSEYWEKHGGTPTLD